LAAHRGDAGLRITDTDATSAGGQWAWLQYDLPPNPGVLSSYYFRAWIRFTGTPLGDSIVMRLASGGPTYCQIRNALTVPKYFADAVDAVGTSYQVGASVTGSEGPWQLVELGLEGMNTLDAGFTLWIDGGSVATFPGGLDMASNQVAHVLFGEPYATDSSFTGTIDFDDVRTATAPPASILSVSGPAIVAAGACHPFGLSLTASNGTPAPAPYDFVAAISMLDSGGVRQIDGGVFLDSSCAAQEGGVGVLQAQTQVTFWARFDQAGTVTLKPGYVDFLSKATAVAVVSVGVFDAGRPQPDAGIADSGPDGGAALLPPGLTANLGCGSSGAGITSVLLPLLGALIHRRRGAGIL
jgi:uncharacterized protein (TIGR03382 family)